LRWKDTAGIFPAVFFGREKLEVAGRCVRDEIGVSADVRNNAEAEESAASNNDAEAEKFAASKKSFHHFRSRHIYHLIHVPVYQRS
jgi:hypothetical protein